MQTGQLRRAQRKHAGTRCMRTAAPSVTLRPARGLQNLAPRTHPHEACDLLDAPPWAPLKEADRGPLYSSFSVGFMHGGLPRGLPRHLAMW